jgi:muramoyltetrapeptide carboxypeptidase
MPLADDIVLFVEDDNIMGDYFIYEFDRNFQSLLQAYRTEKVKGVVFGRFDDSCHMSADVVKSIIADKLTKDIPVMFGVDFGHVFPMITFPIGGRVKMEATADPQIEIEYH